jgi:hypothetical protein
MVALAVAAMPSSRPVKPSRSLVVALTATRDTEMPAISAIRARIASRADLRPLADQRHFKVGDAAAALADAPDRIIQEAVGRCTFPFRIARRKVRADIAVGQRAEQGIDQRVEPDIAVGMGNEAFVERHAYAADHHVVAVTQRVDVIAGAGADVAQGGGQPRLFAGKILRRRQLDIQGIALEGRNRHAGPLGKRGIVGEFVQVLMRGAAVSVKNFVEAKHLRRLGDAQVGASRCADDLS